MTVSDTTRNKTFVGAGSTGPFTFSFRILDDEDITVTKIVDSTGVRTVLATPADYSNVLVDLGLSGGSITTVANVETGETLLVEGATPRDQLTKYRNLGRFDPEIHERSFDKLTMVVQEFGDSLDRTLTLPAEVTGVSTILPSPVSGRALEWSADALSVVNSSLSITQAIAALVNVLTATSVTSNNLTTGSKTFTLDTDVPFPDNMPVQITNTLDTTEKIFGNVTSYVSSTKVLTVEIDAVNGSGSSIITWQVIATGPPNQILATATVAGISEHAIASEIDTGTDLTRVITPAALSDSDTGIWWFEFFIANPLVGDAALFFQPPAEMAGMDIFEVLGQWNNTIGTGAATSIQLHNFTQTADVLSTNLTIDDGERSAVTAATPAVIDTDEDDITLNDIFQIDFDVIGSTVAGTGLLITVKARLP